MKQWSKSCESGFTLIELLYVVSIVGILSSLSWGAFYVYKDDAEYSRAEYTLRNAKTALEVGDQESANGASAGFEYSGVDGSGVGGDIGNVMPGMTVPKDVRVGVLYNKCSNAADAMTINQFIVSQPCNSTKHIRYTRFCGGAEITLPEVAQDKGCPNV
ncbi:MAG: type II secretion system protein [bacterium]|nr:type II secretion system protein [bacterium]